MGNSIILLMGFIFLSLLLGVPLVLFMRKLFRKRLEKEARLKKEIKAVIDSIEIFNYWVEAPGKNKVSIYGGSMGIVQQLA